MEMSDAPKGRKVTIYASQLTALRARVAGLETSAARLRADLDLTQGAVAEEVKARVATEQRAATLQAEVERLTRERDDSYQRARQMEIDLHAADAEGESLTQKLAESERKRAELLARSSPEQSQGGTNE